MRHCPHCQTKVNIWQQLRMTRWRPYVCPGCSAKFQPYVVTSLVIFGLTLIIGWIWMFAVGFLERSEWVGMFGWLVLFGLIVWAQWFFIPFKEIEKQESDKLALTKRFI
jgi:hypothetical protein